MKKLGILAVMALLMMFGCTKDDLINTNQEPFSIEENNQPVVNGIKQGLVNAKFGRTSFFSRSIKNNVFIKQWTQKNETLYPNLTLERKLLKQGTFSGNIQDFGKINSSISFYTFSYCEPLPIDSPPNYGEPLMYKLIGDGKIYLSTRDYCSITVTGNVYPWYYTDIQFDGGLFIGTATTSLGTGKLKNFNKTFEIYSNGRINLTTGEIPLNITEPM